jgi:4'-phosphopantetheinyl transferase EntD
MALFSDIKKALFLDGLYFTGATEFRTVSDLLPFEAQSIAQAIPSRQREFATGRWCARALFREMGLDPAAPVARGKSGEPLWPLGVCGSISHAREACCVVTGFTKKYRSIGLDIENVGRPLSDGARRMILNDDEARWIDALADTSGNPWCTVFSIKESVGKLVFALIDRMPPFSAVSVMPLTEEGRFACRINEELGAGFESGRALRGRLFRGASLVIAVAVLEQA